MEDGRHSYSVNYAWRCRKRAMKKVAKRSSPVLRTRCLFSRDNQFGRAHVFTAVNQDLTAQRRLQLAIKSAAEIPSPKYRRWQSG